MLCYLMMYIMGKLGMWEDFRIMNRYMGLYGFNKECMNNFLYWISMMALWYLISNNIQ